MQELTILKFNNRLKKPLELPPEHKVKLLKRSNRQTLCSRQSLSTYVHVGNVAKSECAMDGADESPVI